MKNQHKMSYSVLPTQYQYAFPPPPPFKCTVRTWRVLKSVRHGRLETRQRNSYNWRIQSNAVGQNKIISCNAQNTISKEDGPRKYRILAMHDFTAMSQPSLIPVIAGFETPALPSNLLFFSSHSRFHCQSGQVDPQPHVGCDNVISRRSEKCPGME